MADEVRMPLAQRIEERPSNTNTSSLEEDLGSQSSASTSSSQPFSGIAAVPNRGNSGDDILQKINFNPVHNEMGNYDQPTYYVRFSLVSDDPASSSSVIIAESGVTALNVTELRIDQMVGPNFKSRNVNATSMTLRVFEPMGANLPDRMLAAAKKLQIRNYHKAQWRLYVRLHGYTEDGRPVSMIGGREWQWNTMITDIQSQVNESGSSHVIKMIPYNEVALFNQFGVLTDTFTAQGETIGDVLTKLKEDLNNDIVKRYGYPFIQYDIRDEPYRSGTAASAISRPFDHKLKADKPQENISRNAEGGQFSKGTDVPSVIDSLFAQSDTAVMMAAGIDDLASANPQNTNTVSVMHRVETHVHIIGFDEVLNDYQRVVEFVIRPYDTLRVISNVQAASDVQKPETNLKRAQHANATGLMKKQYDYLFTGLNTEVLTFDINLNFRWSVSSSLFQGLIHSQMASMPKAYNEEARERLRTSAAQEVRALINQEQRLIQQGAGDPQKLAELQRQQREQDNLQNQTGMDLFVKRQGNRADLPEGTYYADDLLSEKSSQFDVYPVTITQDGNDPRYATQSSTDSHWHRGKSVYGMLLNQLYGSFDGNLQNIQLEIKGDPYWIGPTNLDDLGAAPSNTQASFSMGEHIFVFRLKLPQGYDDDTGNVSISDNEAFSGFYAAIRVEHVFQGGMFKQNLHGTRVPGWDISKIIA